MKLDGFIAALRASGLEPDAESVADFFFLASRMPKQAELLVATSVPVPASSDTTSGGAAGTETSQGVQQALESQAESARKTGLFTPSHGAEGTVPAAEIEVPEAPALPRALEIARSLRPLSQRFRAGGTGVLDEEATAEQSAHHRQLILAFQPRHERWFDVALVIDDTPSMAVWKTTIEAFERVLVGHGAFRDVRLWRFWADAILIDPAGRPVGSSALIAPGGRRIILILTQGVSAAWQSKAFADAILEWAHRQPTAVIQLLPERLWENTRLGEPKTLARSPRPGLPNVQWDVELPAWMKRRIPDGVALPVLALNPGCLGSWAKMLMARLGSAAPSVYWSALAATSSTDAKPDVPDLAPEERLDRFRRIASDDGFRLATALSAGPVTLAVLRLVNQTLFGEFARQETLAQILLGGILRRSEDSPDPELVYYDFHPGVREFLARSLQSEDHFAVRRQVTRYLQQHTDTTRRFRALVPHREGKRRLPDWALPFANEDEALLRAYGLWQEGPVSGTVPVASTIDETAEPVRRRRSILVGIDEYVDQNLTQLTSCVREATALGSALRERGFDVSVLVNRDATRRNILAALEDACTRSGQNDLVWFHYSGHANYVQGRSAIMPHDARSMAPQAAIELKDIAERLRRAGVRVLITGDGAPPGPPPVGVAYLVGPSAESSTLAEYRGVAPIMLAALARISRRSSITLGTFAEAVRSECEHIRIDSSATTDYELASSLGTIENITLFESLDAGEVEVRPDHRSEPSTNDDRRSPLSSRQRALIRSLPPATSLFIGRAEELAALERAWNEQITTLIQILGSPGDLSTRNALAEVLRKTGRLPEAEQLHRETLQRFPEDLSTRNGMARVLREMGRLAEAEQVYRETLQRFPEDLSTRNGMARVLRDMGRLAEAEQLYRETLQRFPNNLIPRTGLAELLRETRRLAEAEELYRETLQRFPNNLIPRNGLAELLRETRRLPEAEQLYRETLQRFPTDLIPRNGLAELLRETRRLTEAEELYRDTLLRFPNDSIARNGLAELLRETRRLPEAEELYRETLQRLPNDLIARNGLAELLREARRLPEAEELYRETLHRSPNDLTARNGLAELLREMDRLPEIEQLRSLWTKMDHSANTRRIFSDLAGGRVPALNKQEVAGVELVRLLNRLITDMRAISSPSRGLRWAVSDDRRLLDIRLVLDLDLFQQAVMNVLDNAAKYSNANSLVNIDVTTGDNFLIISVSNRGLPITPSDARRIVERGFRGANAMKVTQEGLGIGLWVTDQILRIQGATLEIIPTSAEGNTVVSLRFPLVAPRRTRSRA